MRNEKIKLNNVVIPYIVDSEGVEYYPIKYIMEKFLLKRYNNFHNKDNFKPFIKRCIVDYSFVGTSPQETNCITKEGWIEYFKSSKPNKNKTDIKIERLKIFYEYLGLEFKDQTKEDYDLYTLKCIEEFKKVYSEVEYKKCVRCGLEFPDHRNFYGADERIIAKRSNVCRKCIGGNWINENKQHEYIYNNYGLNKFCEYLQDKDKCIKNIISNMNLPEIKLKLFYNIEEQKNLLLEMTKEIYETHNIPKISLNKDNIRKFININNSIWTAIPNNAILSYCTNNDSNLRPWLYSNVHFDNISIKEGISIIKTYICENNIKINDIFTYNHWGKLLKESKITRFNNNLLGFVVEFYDRQYAGYKFKISSSNYYKDKNNMIFDMKYLIEKDMNIPIAKIPLYITKYTLSRNAKKLYHALRNNGYYNDLYTWINDCYPDMFIESDFNINPYRSNFDSLEEAQVDEQLKLKFKGVIYNPRDEINRVEFNGCIPDWILPTNKGCYLVEYYGLWQEKDSETSHRLQRYKQTHDKKIEVYSELEKVGYKHLGIYPDDLKNNFEGLHKKLDDIIN